MWIRRGIPLSFLGAVLLIGFQNCGSLNFGGNGKQDLAQNGSGNGDTYTGKPEAEFLFTEASNPCGKLNASGVPFPTRQISLIGGQAFLVRDNCQDFNDPVLLKETEYQYDSAQSLIVYQGQSFNLIQNLNDYYLVPPICPAGTSVVASPTNLIPNPFHFLAQGWYPEVGIATTEYGVIEVLPRFRILRNDSSLLEVWRRHFTVIDLNGNTDYVYSFVIEQGNTGFASVSYWADANNQFEVQYEFSTGQITYPWMVGFTSVQASVRPYGRAYILDVFFRTGTDATTYKAGIGPHPSNGTTGPQGVGEYIYSTGAAIHDVNSYCQ
ncbi:MAG: hypothetical protein AB7F86_08895 [Bdellovibrionales bacterium]